MLPNHLEKEIGMESTEQPPTRMSLIKCRNGLEALEDIEGASLSGKWVNPESREALRTAEMYLDNHDTEIATVWNQQESILPSRRYRMVMITRSMTINSVSWTAVCMTIRM